MSALPRLGIFVFKGDPVDLQMYRHTSMFLTYQDDTAPLLVHITGVQGEFQFVAVPRYTPEPDEATPAKIIDVGPLKREIGRAEAIAKTGAIVIDHSDREYNCQTWVERALKMLHENSYITEEAYTQGLDAMVDAIAEAEDEE